MGQTRVGARLRRLTGTGRNHYRWDHGRRNRSRHRRSGAVHHYDAIHHHADSADTPNNIPQPIFVSGRVMLDDGTPPPQSVTIETVCNGTPHGEGYTDAKGYFSFELGGRNGVIQDASEMTAFNSMGGNSPMGGPTTSPFGNSQSAERKYMGCDLQAKLTGYRSQTVPLAGRRSMDNPDVGTILLHRNGRGGGRQDGERGVAGGAEERQEGLRKGSGQHQEKEIRGRAGESRKGGGIYPKYATAWYELGMMQAGEGKMDMARKYFDLALENDPKYVKPYMQIAILELQAQKWQSVADLTDKLVKLDPFDYPQAFFFNSVANYNMQKFEEAEKSAPAAERLDTRHTMPKVSHILGMLLAMKKDYAGAAEHFKTYLKFAPNASDAAKVQAQLAEVEKITAASAAGKDQ